MKSMTCSQLGGACDKVFSGETFEAVAALSKTHGMEMFQAKDSDHLAAMDKMKALVQTPADMQTWMDSMRATFDALPED